MTARVSIVVSTLWGFKHNVFSSLHEDWHDFFVFFCLGSSIVTEMHDRVVSCVHVLKRDQQKLLQDKVSGTSAFAVGFHSLNSTLFHAISDAH